MDNLDDKYTSVDKMVALFIFMENIRFEFLRVRMLRPNVLELKAAQSKSGWQ